MVLILSAIMADACSIEIIISFISQASNVLKRCPAVHSTYMHLQNHSHTNTYTSSSKQPVSHSLLSIDLSLCQFNGFKGDTPNMTESDKIYASPSLLQEAFIINHF